ncbi:MAG: hypothetical protein FWB77_02235 [Treponema sp.]|nr:hypothetical protein [Treponema sp.]
MSVSLTKRTTDYSNGGSFSFSFYCDTCGNEWKSLTFPFESGGFTAIESEEVRQLIWAQEHKAAFDKANLEAHFHFSFCSKCGKWVCDDCFNFWGNNKNGICKKCAGV